MAADYETMVKNLYDFYDFSGKTVIAVGAGGGKLAEYGRKARQVLAVDNDPKAIGQLRENLAKIGLAEKFTLVPGDFYQVELKGDAVLFEFCLHEMSDPRAALARARTLAPDVVVFDHAPGSQWAYYVAEEEKTRMAWLALEELPLRARREHMTEQRFAVYEELLEKVRLQGRVAIERIERWRGHSDFVISMTYGLALV